MPTFDVWTIVKVPFPYTDRPVRQRRPALVIASEARDTASGLLWVLMITSAENRGWFRDVEISDLAASGLPVPSIVRTTKIATIDAADAEKLGRLPKADCKKVAANLMEQLSDALKAS
jgi:mRNA interferase MazF